MYYMSNAETIVKFAKTSTPGRTAVIVNGETVAEVFKAPVSRMERYSGVMYGRTVSRMMWAWEGTDGDLVNMGGTEFATRKDAVEDVLCFV